MEAGRAVGLGDAALIWRYLALNCWPTILIYMTLQLGQAILLGAALSFLGLGAQPPTAELGSMAADGRKFLQIAPTSRPSRARRSSSSFSLSTSWATRCATPSIPSSGNKEAVRQCPIGLLLAALAATAIGARDAGDGAEERDHRARDRHRPLRPAQVDGALGRRGHVHDRRHAGEPRLRHEDAEAGPGHELDGVARRPHLHLQAARRRHLLQRQEDDRQGRGRDLRALARSRDQGPGEVAHGRRRQGHRAPTTSRSSTSSRSRSPSCSTR